MINARVDVWLEPYINGAEPGTQAALVPAALERANAYLEAGADCVYPIALWESDALHQFMEGVAGPVNVTRMPEVPSLNEVVALGVVRVSWAIFLFEQAMSRFKEQLESLRG